MREQRITKEINKLKNKQEIELKNLLMKGSVSANILKKKRALEFDNLVQRFKNKMKDLENETKREKIDFNRLKDSSRIMSEVSFISSNNPILF